MNILFVVKEFPHSRVIGGPIIIYNRVKYLSADHTVSLVAFGEDLTAEQVESVSRYCREVRVVPPVEPPGLLQELRQLFGSPVPPYFMLAYSERMYEEIRGVVADFHYDAVISEYSMVAQYLYGNRDLEGIKRVMSVHECYYLARRKALRIQGLSREGARALYHLTRLKRFELDMYSNADRVLTLTEEGREELLRLRPGLDISVVPHGVDVDEFSPRPRPAGPPTVMFLGNYLHDPNRDAVMYFGTRAWPLVKKKVPDARFLVVGRGPTTDMLELARSDPSIEVTGQVEDVRPYLWRSDVFVCPVRMGGGFRGKMLEAMAAGVPVVTTALGAEGIHARDGENMLLAQSPEQLAERAVALLEDRKRAAEIAAKARELVVERYSWRKGVEILEEVLREVVEL